MLPTRIKRLRPLLLQPGLGPWAGVLFLFSLPFLIGGRFTYPTPPVRLPSINTQVCWQTIDKALIISVDSKNRSYIEVNDDSLQSLLIQQVAAQHQVYFTKAQLKDLHKIPFLSHDIRLLPAWLSAPESDRSQFPVGIPATYRNNQVFDYISNANQVSRAVYGKRLYFCIRADKDLLLSQVIPLFQFLQKQHIKYFLIVNNGKY
ncbi:hypothetical protein [Hymenobacter sp. BT491]|uniref:hypothetical protein n=1 Tax=Hymenobacter sp. BT491 TaxID=2766779 RepID=UPI001653AF79|nr:hypothetical protein [Hymenobacter sp. BT491]MBC6988466.1 hypothetical protein [Hymenobacter sp. BT491]